MLSDFEPFQLSYLAGHSFDSSKIVFEKEGKEYQACWFCLNDKKIISRKAKLTPKKVGQFVTFWKRPQKETEPYSEADLIDELWVWVEEDLHRGLFVFSKDVLIQEGILSSINKEGKRGFRVYPPWVVCTNKQAIKTQKWQLDSFVGV